MCIIIWPPFTHSYLVANKLKNCYLGGQNCSLFLEGAYTGDVSATMLYDVGCQFCLVGHSERRTIFNETNNEVSIKATNSLQNNIHPIICIGETLQQKKDNRTKEILFKQIKGADHFYENHKIEFHNIVNEYINKKIYNS